MNCPACRNNFKMSGEETDPIHIDSETEQHVGGGVDECLQSLPLAILSRFRNFNWTSLPNVCLQRI